MIKGTFKKLALFLVIAILSTAAATFFYLKELYPVTIICGAILIDSTAKIFRIYSQDKRKLAFMFNSIENDDFSFNFTTHNSSTADVLLNTSLNRIKELLMLAKMDLAQKEKYYELIMASAGTGIIVTNKSGSIYQNNEAALKMLGLPVLTHINQLGKIDPQLPPIFASITPGKHKHITFHNERGEVNITLAATSFKSQDRDLKIISFSDIGSELDQRELESWIRLTRVLTHEIMNSITPITSISDTLINLYGHRADKISNGLDVINSTSKGLKSFVESYREFTRIPPPAFTLVYVKQLLSRIDALSGIKPDIHMTSDDIIIHADESQISQVILNLVKNAVEASAHLGDKARIKIDVSVDSNENVIIEVSDNGGGIPPEVAENIFVPFFTTKEKGSGIGLSISRQIMKLHEGALTMRLNEPSGNDRMTTTFSLIFK